MGFAASGVERMAAAHRLAAEAIKSGPGDAKVGWTLALVDLQPVEGGDERCEQARKGAELDWLDVSRDDDFVGVQTYSRYLIGPDGKLPPPSGTPLTQTGWEVYPDALGHTVRLAAERAKVPVLVTENGMATDDDDARIAYTVGGARRPRRVHRRRHRRPRLSPLDPARQLRVDGRIRHDVRAHRRGPAVVRPHRQAVGPWLGEVARANELGLAPRERSSRGDSLGHRGSRARSRRSSPTGCAASPAERSSPSDRAPPNAREAFAQRFDIPRHHGSYEELAADADVDAVYVATPPSRHAADALLFLGAGKHVLCEKPFTLNATQTSEVVRAAREHDRFVMEAMWSRFLPAYVALRGILDEGRIGEPLLVEADFGWRSPVVPTERHYDLEQGGGALLDLGVYTVQLCTLVLGAPDAVVAQGHVGTTGVDEVSAAVLHYPGRPARSREVGHPHTADLHRAHRRHRGFDRAARLHALPGPSRRARRRRASTASTRGWEGEGLRFQVDEVHRCLDAGLLESPRMPWHESIAIAEVLDAIRAQIGMRYPGERA